MSTENQAISDAEKELIDSYRKHNHAPVVKEIINHIETAYAVIRPSTNSPVCYCTSKKDAEMIAHAIKFTIDMTASYIIHKVFN